MNAEQIAWCKERKIPVEYWKEVEKKVSKHFFISLEPPWNKVVKRCIENIIKEILEYFWKNTMMKRSFDEGYESGHSDGAAGL